MNHKIFKHKMLIHKILDLVIYIKQKILNKKLTKSKHKISLYNYYINKIKNNKLLQYNNKTLEHLQFKIIKIYQHLH